MKIGKWARLLLAAAPLLAGCGDFWQALSGNSSTSFTLSNIANIAVAPNSTSTADITVTPGSSFNGTVTFSCAVTTWPSGATSSEYPTCGFNPASVSITSTAAATSTLTLTTLSSTPLGAYDITVTGASNGVDATASFCVEVASPATGTCTPVATTSGNFYILNSTTIAGYSVNNGVLTPIPGSSLPVTSATAIAIAPSGLFLYVASTGGGITLYTINQSSGALTQGADIFADPAAEAIQVDPSGKWLLDASGTGTLNAYPITASGTQDTSRSIQSPAPSLASLTVEPGGIAISPNGALVSVALGTTGTQSFSFNANLASPIGAALPITKPFGGNGAAIAVAIDSQGRLYIGETAAFNPTSNSGALRVFTIGANSLTEFPYTTPYAPAGTGPHAILPDPTGDFVYVASGQSGSAGEITGYSVTSSALTALTASVATGTNPMSLAEDNTGSFVLVANNQGSTPIDAYTFDSTTKGQLDTSSLTGSTGADPIAIVAAPKQ
jgi:6-phosphogluconolactonase (cycloisomerase 2 family)